MKQFFTPLFFTCILLSTLEGYSQKLSSYNGISKEELLERSVTTSVFEEKQKIRKYLADKFPNSMEGATAKAWIDGKEGYPQKETEGYMAVINQYPNAWLATLNSLNIASVDKLSELVKNYEKLLTEQPSYSNYTGVRNFYNTVIKWDPALAKEKLNYWEKKIGSDVFIFDFIRGIEAEGNRDYKLAASYYESALEKKNGKDEIELWTRLINIRKDKLFDNENKKTQDQYNLFASLINEARSRKNSTALADKVFIADAEEFAGDFVAKFDEKMAIEEHYGRAYEAHPSYPLLKKITEGTRHTGITNILDDVLAGEKDLPDNSNVQWFIATLYLEKNDVKNAEKYLRLAVANAVLMADKFVFSYNLTSLILDGMYFDYAQSESILSSFLGKLPDDAKVYIQLLENRMNAGDYAKAKDYLLRYNEIAKKLKDYKATYYDNELYAINKCLADKSALEKYYTDNPFEKKWNANYKDGLQLYINFSTNSANIPATDFTKLDDLAKQISDNGADEYSFLISGHTDNTGTDEINDPLSYQRAKSIVNYLYNKHKIPFVRMDYKGYGSKQPISDNFTEIGKGKNRRVEITLSANIKKPILAVTTTLETSSVKFSKDGKYFIAGNPMKLWDANEKIMLFSYEHSLSKRTFSPNSKYIAGVIAYYDQYFLLILDVRTGKIMQQQSIPWNKEGMYEIHWLPTSSELVIGGYNGTILLYDVKNSKLTKSYKTSSPLKMSITPDGKYLGILHTYKNGTLEIIDAKTFLPVITKNVMIWPHAIAASADSRYFLCSDDDRQLYVYNTDKWTYRTMNASAWAQQIASHPTKNIFALNDHAGGEHNKVEIIDIDKMSSLAIRDIGSEKIEWQFNADGSKIMGTIGSKIEVLNAQTLQKMDHIEGESSSLISAFKDNENQLITVDEEAINVWDIKSGTKNHYWAAHPISLKQLSGSNEFIALNEDKQLGKSIITRYNTQNFTQKEIIELPYQIDKWVINNDAIFLLAKNFVPVNTGNTHGHILVYNLQNGRLINDVKVFLPTAQMKFSLAASGFYRADISPDGAKIAFSSNWQDGFGRESTTSNVVKVVDFKSGNTIKEINYTEQVYDIVFLSNSSILINKSKYNLQNNAFNNASQEEINQVTTMGLSFNGKSEFDFESLNILVKTNDDNQFEFIHKKTNQLILTIAAKKKNEWIAYTPSGNYTASINGTSRVNWILGSRRLPFDALKTKFENPSLIKNLLGSVISNTPAVVTPPAIKVEPDIFVSPYKMEILSPSDAVTKENTYSIELKITKENASIPDAQVFFEINGRKISDRGFGVATIVKTSLEQLVKKTISLQEGFNTIKAYIDYKQAQVEIHTVNVTKQAVPSTASITPKAQLWFFGVGVSKYEKPSQNLEYADKDVTSIADLFKKQEGILYQKVNSKVLTNADATEKNVRIELNEFLKMASADDIIILFMAGHGTQDNDQNLFYMTHDADITKPYTGMDIAKVKNFLANRPINQKAALWLDICHAGTVKTGMIPRGLQLSSEEAIKELAEGTGTIVLASSTGKESSFESAEFGGGHGAFSFAILKALEGNADKLTGDKNGYVSLLEMQQFVSRKVVELTKGEQHPTTPQSINVRDFPIFKY